MGTSYAIARNGRANNELNKLYPEDRTIHDWYRFVLSFPPHLVRRYIERFQLESNQCVLDPFCGTGTVLVECKKLGIPSVGVEANPMAHFASRVKVDWDIDADRLLEHARQIAEMALTKLRLDGIEDEPFFHLIEAIGYSQRTLPTERLQLLLTNSISPRPLHKTLVLLECIEQCHDERYHRHELLALAKALVYPLATSNLGQRLELGL